MLRFPDKVLDEIALILGQEQQFGLLDNLAHIRDQGLTFCRQLRRRRGQRLGLEEAIQRNIDLVILSRVLDVVKFSLAMA